MKTTPFARFISPARARRQIWRLCLGTLVIVAIWFAVTLLPLGVIWTIGGGDVAGRWGNWLAAGASPTAMFALLGTFAGALIGAAVAVRLLHKRTLRSLFGRISGARRDFAMALAVVGVLYALAMLLATGDVSPRLNQPAAVWLLLLPLSLFFVALQTLAEEVVFRGYLLQQLAVRFKSPLIWFLLPAIAFGLAHSDPASAGTNAPLIVLAATLFGLIGADLTRRTGSLAAAWGFHFANNTAALLLVATQGQMSGLALFVTAQAMDDPALRPYIYLDLALMVLAWGVLVRMIRR